MSALAAERGEPVTFDDWDVPRAKHESLELYYEHLEETLVKLKFLDPENPRQTITRLRRLFNRVRLDEMELNILRGFLTAIQNTLYHHDEELKERGADVTESGAKPD
jgi:tRNA (cytidine32/uridine32-2'-O)-methyltransferase